jgi:hypothetical protein
MASKSIEQLFEVFMEAAGGATQPLEPPSNAAGEPQGDGSEAQAAAPVSAAAGALADSMREIAGQVTGYSDTYAAHTTSSVSQSGGGGADALSIAKTVFESGLGIVPLVAGLVGLFSGGSSDTPAPLVKYAMPDKVYFEGADTGSGISGSDFDQMGNPRPYDAAPAAATPAPAASPQAGPQITVNVQAIDSRSFLDHSSEIAQAVRDAMLNMSPINDVVNNL